MRTRVVVPCLVSLLFPLACGHDEVAPSNTPAAPAPSAATAAPASSPAATPPAPTGKTLPPVDAKCKADADCATVQLNLDGDLQCCTGCGTSTAGTKAWVTQVTEACAAPPHKNCPALACAGGLLKAECKAGTCTLKK